MLIRFRSDAGDITMFGHVALELIKMMGHSGAVPSAVLARDIPVALENLKQGIKTAPRPPAPGEDQDRDGPSVSLQQRAFPLIELLERCAKNGYDLLWEQQR
jgi:hypothetical protein